MFDIKEDSKLKIVGRYMDGTRVVGYYVIDQTGNGGAISKEVVERLVIEKRVINCTAQVYKGKVILKGVDYKLSELPSVKINNKSVEMFRIIRRVIKDRVIAGYEMIDSYGNVKYYTKETVVELASNGRISNARVQRHKDKIILRGVNCNLAELDTKRID